MATTINGLTGVDNVQDGIIKTSDLDGAIITNSLGVSGYQKVIGGLIIQFGTATAASAASGTSTTVTLPTPFPSSCVCVIATNTGPATSNSTYNTTAKTASSFTVQRGNNGNLETGTSFNWIAIGY